MAVADEARSERSEHQLALPTDPNRVNDELQEVHTMYRVAEAQLAAYQRELTVGFANARQYLNEERDAYASQVNEARVHATAHIRSELDTVMEERDAAQQLQSEADFASATVSRAESTLAETAQATERRLMGELTSLRAEANSAREELRGSYAEAEAKVAAEREVNLNDQRRLMSE